MKGSTRLCRAVHTNQIIHVWIQISPMNFLLIKRVHFWIRLVPQKFQYLSPRINSWIWSVQNQISVVYRMNVLLIVLILWVIITYTSNSIEIYWQNWSINIIQYNWFNNIGWFFYWSNINKLTIQYIVYEIWCPVYCLLLQFPYSYHVSAYK